MKSTRDKFRKMEQAAQSLPSRPGVVRHFLEEYEDFDDRMRQAIKRRGPKQTKAIKFKKRTLREMMDDE